MKYSELEIEDLDEVVLLFIKAFNKEPWNDKWTRDTAYNRLKQMINCEGYYGVKACENEKIIGIILGNHEYYYDGMHFNIKEFCVDSDIKGRGIGSQILEEFICRLKEKGIIKIYLSTLQSDSTIKFYEKNGITYSKDNVVLEKNI